MPLIHYLQQEKAAGSRIILWTCRAGKPLHEAVSWCTALGLSFDAVNDNLPEMNELFQNNSRKVGADIYIDDKAMRVEYTKTESDFWDGLFERVAGEEDA